MGLRRSARCGAPVVALLASVLLVGCATTSRGAPATPSPEVFIPTPEGTSTNSGDIDAPIRWGWDTRENNNQVDPPAHFEALPPGYRFEAFATGLTQPTSIAFLPDGRMLITEQQGAIRIVEDGVLQREPFFVVPSYTPVGPEGFSELGLVGMTVGPDANVYVYYSSDQPTRRTVLARIANDDGRGRDLTEILSMDAPPEQCCHIAGSLRFAPDGTLFVTVGDHQLEAEAQNIEGAFGGILRINPDGSPPADNPFVGEDEADPRRYAYGLRNAFDIAIDPVSGRIFATENGYVGQDAIVEVLPGANYGWPGFSLAVPLAEVEPPLLFYNQTIGPSGAEFYRGSELPWLDGTLLFCHFHRGGALHRVTFADNGSVADDAVIATGCTSDVLTGPDGFVYTLDYLSGTAYRLARGS